MRIRENLEYDADFEEDYEPDWRYVRWWNNKCSFVTSGLRSLKVTLVKAFKQRKEVRWFLCFRAISSSVLVSFAAAVISYLNEQIQITSTNIGITSLIVLFL